MLPFMLIVIWSCTWHFYMCSDQDVLVVYLVVLLGSASLGILIMVFSDSLHHADNFLAVDRFVTPRHIVPEWYFLAWYSVLRSCSSKLIGVILLLFGVLQFMFMVGVGHGSKAST